MKVSFESPQQRAPESRNGPRIPYPPEKRGFPRWRWWLLLLIVFLPLLYLGFRLTEGYFFRSSLGIVEFEKINLTCPLQARVDAVLCTSGSEVRQGQTLFVITPDVQVENLNLLRAEQQGLVKYSRDVIGLDHLRQAVALAQQEREYWEKYLSMVQDLFEKGAATRAEVDAAQKSWREAQNDLIRAQNDLDRATKFVNPQYAIRLGQIREEMALISRAPTKVLAPTNGIVISVYANSGQKIGPGTLLATLANRGSIRFVAFVDPKLLNTIHQQQRIEIRFPNGYRTRAALKGDPKLVQDLPRELGTPFVASSAYLRVELQPLEKIPGTLLLDGMPFSVNWGWGFGS